MLLITGLGNPGEKYKFSRHNVGFLFTEYLLKEGKNSTVWKYDTYSNAEIAKTSLSYNTQEFILHLAKPQTYMNRSGESIRVLMKNNNIDENHLIVAHDDLDVELGKYKIQLGIGPKKHNGLTSIQNHLHTNDFLRLRIGIDNRDGDRSLSGEEYVLKNFTSEEMVILQDVFEKLHSALLLKLNEIYT